VRPSLDPEPGLHAQQAYQSPKSIHPMPLKFSQNAIS